MAPKTFAIKFTVCLRLRNLKNSKQSAWPTAIGKVCLSMQTFCIKDFWLQHRLTSPATIQFAIKYETVLLLWLHTISICIFTINTCKLSLHNLPRPVATGGRFGVLAHQKNSKPPPNWNMKHYKAVEFLSIFGVSSPPEQTQSPTAETQTPYWKLSGNGSALTKGQNYHSLKADWIFHICKVVSLGVRNW